MTGVYELTLQCSVAAARAFVRDELAWLDQFACRPGSRTRAMLSGAMRSIDEGWISMRDQIDYAEDTIATILAADLEPRQGPFPIDNAREILQAIAEWKEHNR